MRPYKFNCHQCKRSQRDQPSRTICERCNDDAATIRRVCYCISLAFPGKRDTPAGVLFAQLWAHWLKNAVADLVTPGDIIVADNLVKELEEKERQGF